MSRLSDVGEKTVPRVRGVPAAVEHARHDLRRAMTPAETILWAALRDRRAEGLKFRRQHAAGPFVLDFYCPRLKLVVEVDGHGHDDDEEAAHDRLRAEQLRAYGYRVLRIRNEEVMENLDVVLRRIANVAGS